ncbi:MAG: hypothetical protein P8K08_15940 [Fuerstiella sp.]|jgi:hypothetical protein|nr:hypothetical protein [Fuerstiella sp.]
MATKTKTASRIAEISVNVTFVSVDLEIGPQDLTAFSDLSI